MDAARRTKISKFLSRYLRHSPQALGLTLAAGGWVGVDELLAACQRRGLTFSRADLDEVVATNDKQRFSFDSSGRHIRANQGHSAAVDLLLQPAQPPDELYHGTSEAAVAAILIEGLIKMSRHHVHLSRDTATAVKVGSRHGRPFVFAVDAARMVRDECKFFCSDNGVWLVDAVPPGYLRPIA